MQRKLILLALAAFGAASLTAQEGMPVTLGLKVGVPVTDMFSTGKDAGQIPGSNYSSGVPRYEVGVSSEFHLPYHLRFEVDGLFRRGGFSSSSVSPYPFGSSTLYRSTGFNEWEIPGLFKYNVSLGHFRPFIDFGAAFRHISTINQTTYGIVPYGVVADNASELSNRNSFGGVAGFGFTFKKGPLELTPEARYTRWANQSFTATGLRTNLDQGDVLLGISF
jgi:Outer membrane protein beta-barrel domain